MNGQPTMTVQDMDMLRTYNNKAKDKQETLKKGIEDCEVERDANDGTVSRCEGRIRPKWVDL